MAEVSHSLAGRFTNPQRSSAMSTTTTTVQQSAAADTRGTGMSRRQARAVSVAAAVICASAIYLVAAAAGVDFKLTSPGGSSSGHLTLAIIAEFTLFCSGLGWATLAILERRIRRAHAVWGTLAAAVLLLSYVPIGIEQASTATRIMLVLIHTSVAAALFPMLRQRPGSAQRTRI
jgi:heme A synthase